MFIATTTKKLRNCYGGMGHVPPGENFEKNIEVKKLQISVFIATTTKKSCDFFRRTGAKKVR